jgi:hypothetical protein
MAPGNDTELGFFVDSGNSIFHLDSLRRWINEQRLTQEQHWAEQQDTC